MLFRSVFYVTLREKISLLLYGTPRFAFAAPHAIARGEALEQTEWFRYYPGYYRENLRKIAEIAREHQVKLLFLKPPLSAERRRGYPLYTRAFERLLEELIRVSQEESIPIVDLDALSSAPRSTAYFSEDGLHFSDAGNAVIARSVADALLAHAREFFP